MKALRKILPAVLAAALLIFSGCAAEPEEYVPQTQLHPVLAERFKDNRQIIDENTHWVQDINASGESADGFEIKLIQSIGDGVKMYFVAEITFPAFIDVEELFRGQDDYMMLGLIDFFKGDITGDIRPDMDWQVLHSEFETIKRSSEYTTLSGWDREESVDTEKNSITYLFCWEGDGKWLQNEPVTMVISGAKTKSGIYNDALENIIYAVSWTPTNTGTVKKGTAIEGRLTAVKALVSDFSVQFDIAYSSDEYRKEDQFEKFLESVKLYDSGGKEIAIELSPIAMGGLDTVGGGQISLHFDEPMDASKVAAVEVTGRRIEF